MEVRRVRADLVRNLKPYAMSDVIVYPLTCRRQKSRWSRLVTFSMLLLRKCRRPAVSCEQVMNEGSRELMEEA